VEKGGVIVSVKSSFKQFPARLDYNSCLCIDVICLSVCLFVHLFFICLSIHMSVKV